MLFEVSHPFSLHGDRTRTPLLPSFQGTILLAAQAAFFPIPCVTLCHLRDHAIALSATGFGQLPNGPVPGLKAFTTRGTAKGPALPRSEMAWLWKVSN